MKVARLPGSASGTTDIATESSGGGVFALALAMLLTVLWWDTQRYLALAVLCAFFLGAGCVCLVAVLRIRGDGARLFAASLAELARDRDALDKKS